MTRRRSFFVERLPGSGVVELTGPQARHLTLVLRLGHGDEVVLFDGAGNGRYAVIEEIRRSGVLLALRGAVEAVPRPTLRMTVLQAVLRPSAMEKMLVMCSELGVEEVVPILTDRCRSRGPGPERLGRWKRLAVESAKQSGRASVMAVAEPARFDSLPMGGWEGLDVFLHPAGDVRLDTAGPGPERLCRVFVGPEGGWSPRELEMALGAGLRPVRLGPRSLRAETAAVAAAAVLQHLYGDT